MRRLSRVTEIAVQCDAGCVARIVMVSAALVLMSRADLGPAFKWTRLLGAPRWLVVPGTRQQRSELCQNGCPSCSWRSRLTAMQPFPALRQHGRRGQAIPTSNSERFDAT